MNNLSMLSQEQVRNLPHIERYDELRAQIPYRILVETEQQVEYYKSLEDQNLYKWMALTVVFKNTRDSYTKSECEDEYRTRVLYKIKKQIKRNVSLHEGLIPFDDLFYYEKEEKSKKSLSRERTPKHVHAMIPIPYVSIDKIWNIELEQPVDRIFMDIKSIHTVDHVFIDPIRTEEIIKWMCYIKKQKGLFRV